MPHISRKIDTTYGPLTPVRVGVSYPRRDALTAHGHTPPPPVKVLALVDTGSSGTMIHSDLIAALGLTPTGRSRLTTATTGTSPVWTDTYDISLSFRAPQRRPTTITELRVAATDFTNHGFQVLLGRDILAQCLLVYDGRLGCFMLSY